MAVRVATEVIARAVCARQGSVQSRAAPTVWSTAARWTSTAEHPVVRVRMDEPARPERTVRVQAAEMECVLRQVARTEFAMATRAMSTAAARVVRVATDSRAERHPNVQAAFVRTKSARPRAVRTEFAMVTRRVWIAEESAALALPPEASLAVHCARRAPVRPLPG